MAGESYILSQVKRGEKNLPFSEGGGKREHERERGRKGEKRECIRLTRNSQTAAEWKGRGRDGGVTFVAIFGGSLFFTCSDRERVRNADNMA